MNDLDDNDSDIFTDDDSDYNIDIIISDNIENTSDSSDFEVNDNYIQDRCKHYNTNCKIISPCCNKQYSCRLCHNESETHEIDRYSITNVICNFCKILQPISNKCINCSLDFASYFCKKCNFLDFPPINKHYYHCDDCNICRVGIKDNYYHCSGCNCCLSISLKNKHICKQNLLHDDCCICLDNLFYSTRISIKLPCGHFIHSHCLNSYINTNKYTCPLCRKTILSGATLQNHIYNTDQLIANNPLPDNLRHFINIKCNDCEKITENTSFHPYGLKCYYCGGYNTSQ